jgi:hypothetical protein
MKKYTKAEQKKLLDAMPEHVKKSIVKMVEKENMKGQGGAGITDILKKAKSLMGPLASVVGPIALKEFILPALKKKLGAGKKTPVKSRIKRLAPIDLLTLSY